MKSWLLVMVAVCLVLPGVSSARTWYVNPDGTGDTTGLQVAIGWASWGDTVLVAAGTYGTVNLKAGVTVISEEGADRTFLDAGGNISAVTASTHDSAEITGFTIMNARWIGIHVSGSYELGPLVIKRNRILDCGWEGEGGINVGGTSALIESNYVDCPNAVYAVEVSTGSPPGVTIAVNGNAIKGSREGVRASGHISIEGNLIINCTYGVTGGDIAVQSNTIVNCGTGIEGAFGPLSHNIITQCGKAIDWSIGAVPAIACNDLWDNTQDYAYEPAPTDIHVDPLFCDPESGDYRLQACSPCVDVPDCGLIGAFGVGCPCGGVSTERASWGAIKSTYR
ncbi:hypothetical protein ACFL2Z_00870 [Candidatus Eisenbacteria bacterium]|uniref:Right handed beta helix domain-containing protein n=1 Tax=Eiseniibacteriota bacterium TaxID=2212470 RepID=A0ABV6YN43_UNCEI